LLLREANTGETALVRTYGALARNALVVGETRAFARFTVADTLVRAFGHRVSIIRIYYFANPSRRPEGKTATKAFNQNKELNMGRRVSREVMEQIEMHTDT
jgi:hypothetical protein